MIRFRSVLAHALAALLLLQWSGLPTQGLALSALQIAIDTSICVPARDAQGHPVAPGHDAPWAGQLCPAAHAFDHTAVLPPSAMVPVPVRWTPTTAPWLFPTDGPVAPRAPPLQPRAPPRLA
jgi:hypothetical protein